MTGSGLLFESILEESINHVSAIPLSNPDITDRERQAVMDVLHTSTLSIGPRLEAFEASIAERAGVRFAVGMNSGTSTLHTAVIAAGIKAGDEVITTPFSFVASANAAQFVGAQPVFADIDEQSFNLIPESIEEKITPKTRAILPVHVFGRPCNMPAIMALAEKHGLVVIEDACEALGASVAGRAAGSYGLAGTFAFYPNKQITTGEGGMLVTNDENVARTARSLRNQGRAEMSTWLDHERLGYNYRMSEINAALGVVQMERLDEILAARAQVASWYQDHLKDIPSVIVPAPPEPGVELSWFVYVIRIEGGLERREAVITRLQQEQIGCGRYFPSIHLLQFYREAFGYKPSDFPVTERVANSTIALPFYSRLQEPQVEQVADVLRKAIETSP